MTGRFRSRFRPRNRAPGKRLIKRSFLETPWGRHWPSRNQWIELAKPTGDDLTQKPHGAFGPSQQKHDPLCASLVVRSRPPPSLHRSVVNWIPDAADRSPNRCETASNARPTSRNRATPPTTMPEPSSVGESGQPPEAAPKERSGRYRSPNQTRRTARRMSPAIMTTTAGGTPARSPVRPPLPTVP